MAKATKDERIEFRAEPADVKRWRAAADAEGMALSMWIRWTCNKATKGAK